MFKVARTFLISVAVASAVYGDTQVERDIAMLKDAVAKLVLKIGEMDSKMDQMIHKHNVLAHELDDLRNQRIQANNDLAINLAQIQALSEQAKANEKEKKESEATVSSNQTATQQQDALPQLVGTSDGKVFLDPSTGKLGIALTEKEVMALGDKKSKSEKSYRPQTSSTGAFKVTLAEPIEITLRKSVDVYDIPVLRDWGSKVIGSLNKNEKVTVDKVTKAGWLHVKGAGWVKGYAATNKSIEQMIKGE